MKILLLYAVNVIAVALPLALFEVWIERFKTHGPRGTEFQGFLGKEIRWTGNCFPFDKDFITPYHLLMFGGLCLAEVIGWALAVNSWITGEIWGTRVVPIAFGIMIVFPGVAVLEDFLYFLVAWIFRVPGQEQKLGLLLSGRFTWHTDYRNLPFIGIKLPAFYLWSPVWIALLLVVHWLLTHFITRLSS